MFHIILLILKIIGIILAALFCLLFVIALFILFVPIRYYGYAERAEEKTITFFRGSWFFRLLLVRLDYKDNTWIPKVKILGILIYPRRKKEKKQKKKKLKKKKEKDKVLDNQTEIKIEKEKIEQEQGEKGKEEEKEKISTIKQKKKRASFFEHLKEKKKQLSEMIKELFRKKELLISFLKEEQNKMGIQLIFFRFGKILKHLGPTKIKGKIYFGTGDPCSTGQIAGVLSLFSRYYNNKVKIIPNFEEQIIEGTFLIKGRIRFFTLLIIVIRLLLNKGFKGLRKSLKQLKEEL